MGFSLSAATAIIGVGVFLSVQYMVSDVIPSMTDTHDSLESMKDRAVNQIQSDITVTNVVNTNPGPLYNLSIYVKNTGSTSLELRYFNVLMNGSVQEFSCNDLYIYPEKTVILNVNNQPDRGIIKIVTDNGISDYYEYAI
jgi:archaellum component FlaF (FlaF/FlaG flagellin family)